MPVGRCAPVRQLWKKLRSKDIDVRSNERLDPIQDDRLARQSENSRLNFAYALDFVHESLHWFSIFIFLKSVVRRIYRQVSASFDKSIKYVNVALESAAMEESFKEQVAFVLEVFEFISSQHFLGFYLS